MKYTLKDGEWIPKADDDDVDEIGRVLKKLKWQPKYIKRQFEIAWNEIFMLKMINEMKDPIEFKTEVLPDLIIAKA